MIQDSIKEKILIVDDLPASIKTIARKLEEHYLVTAATSGAEALEIVRDSLPDLILLDIMMPEMDGYEVCRLLKKDENTQSIPVIFITAKTEKEDEEKGFALGAVDYLTKPVNPAILLARVKTHLELKRHRDNLEKMVGERTIELNRALTLLKAKKESDFRRSAEIHSGRLSILGELATSMAHEINQPLNILSITLQGWRLLDRKGVLTTEKMLSDVQIMLDNVVRITRLVDHVRTLGRTSQDKCSVNLGEIVPNALSLCRMQLLNQKISVNLDLDSKVSSVNAVESEVEQVLLNLLSNSRYVLAEKKETDEMFEPYINISLYQEGASVCLSVEDNGGGVDPMTEENIFDHFYTTKPAGQGTGLGLNICKDLMQKFQGDLILKNKPGQGACFVISLPAEKK